MNISTGGADQSRVKWTQVAVCVLLVAMVAVVFGQTAGFGFVNYDDNGYVYENPAVLGGLTFSGVEWAFTHEVAGHWHPLTVIVLMGDHQLFGSWAGGYHLTNLLLHTAAAVFLFLFLSEMTGARWRSAFVAAVFAIHPLRAESVARVSECKDVLSGMFFMLTLWAYVRYARSKSKVTYALMLVWFALGLMSKPMLVTVPCVLLLLDYWPLGRLRMQSEFPGLFLEKLPLFILSGLSSLAAILALKVGNPPISTYPANAPIAYITYLEKLIYPVGLAAYYPMPKGGWPIWQVFDDVLILAALTICAWWFRRRHPYLPVGWLWYLGMLVPVAGVMQTGNDAYADRYTYLPQIGICIAAAWLAADWTGELKWRRALTGAVSALILGALLVTGRHQVAYWHDSEMLWRHALVSTRDNAVAHQNLEDVLFNEGRLEEAVSEGREAVQVNPDAENYYNLGNALMKQGHIEEGIACCREALRLRPNYADAIGNLGYGLYQQGRTAEAIAEYRQALQIDPANGQTHYSLGTALARLGRDQEAVAEYREALRLAPGLAVTHKNLANSLIRLGRAGEAVAEYRTVLRINPADTSAENALAWILATVSDHSLRDGPEALELATDANHSTGGGDPQILRTLAAAYAQTGDFSNAGQTAQKALDLATARSDAELAGQLRGDLALYQAGRAL